MITIRKVSMSRIQELIDCGYAKDLSILSQKGDVPEKLIRIAYSSGANGMSGALSIGEKTKTLYAITGL